MNYEDFKRAQEENMRRRWDLFQKGFNEAMRQRGDSRTIDDAMAGRVGDNAPDRDAAIATLMWLIDRTDDNDPMTVLKRALGMYKSAVEQVEQGGAVRFVAPDLSKKTLKIRLRKTGT